MTSACELIREQMGGLFICSPHDKYVRLRTPYLYPDGDVIDLFIHQTGDTITVTDLGETLRWFRMQTLSPKRSPKQHQIISDICENHGVEIFKGMLLVRASSPQQLSEAVARLSQAALRVSDLWLTLRTRAFESITDEVADFLTEKGIRYERSEKLPGRSGRNWSIDFHTWTPKRSAFVSVLSSGSRATARSLVEHAVASWVDLSHFKLGPEALKFVSLFDDTVDVWTVQDFNLAETLSTVNMWSRPDEFAETLAA